MSFHLNNAQQMAMYDSLLSLTEREKKHLMSSWAETFSKKIFPFIEEDRFSVLYSDNPASRPNNPVNMPYILPASKNNRYPKTALPIFGQRYINTTRNTVLTLSSKR